MPNALVRTGRPIAPQRRDHRLVWVLLLASAIGACAGDGDGVGTAASPEPDGDADPVEIVARGDDGPRFDAIEPPGAEGFGVELPLRPGRRYELYRTHAELEAAWQALFVDAGLADASALPPIELGDRHVAVGLYLGEQRGGDDVARRYDIALERYVDATGGPVVQVALELLRDCDAPPPLTDPSPFLIAVIELPDEAVASRPVRFVDVIGERNTESCGAPPTDPATLLVRSTDDTDVTLGFVPEPRAEAPRGYTVGVQLFGGGSGVVPNDDALRVRVTDQLPGLNRRYGFYPLDETSPARTVLVSTDAPSDLFDRFVDLPGYVAWLRGIAGEGARNCSAEEMSDEAARESGNCIVEAFGDGAPFFAAIRRPAVDSVAWEGYALDRRGRFLVSDYDSIDFGSNGVPAAGQIFGRQCALPSVLEANGRDFRAGCNARERPPRLDVVLGDGSPFDPGAASGLDPVGPLPLEPLVRGDLVELGNTAANERFARPMQRVFGDQAAFEAFHTSLLACDCAVETPVVDFDTYRVVFVTRGIDTTVGADAAVGDTYEAEGSVSVNVSTTNPADACPDGAPARGPFEFVAVPTVVEPFRFTFGEERRIDPATCTGAR